MAVILTLMIFSLIKDFDVYLEKQMLIKDSLRITKNSKKKHGKAEGNE